jgi:hypothetical protein
VVVQVSGKIQGQGRRPEGLIINIRPVERQMQDGCGSGDAQANGSFSSIILPSGPISTESDGLIVVLESLGNGLAIVDSIVCVICLHNNSMGQGHSLIVVLGHDGAGGAHSDSVLKIHAPRVFIMEEDRGAQCTGLVRLSTCHVEEPSFDLGDEMISAGHTANIWGSLEQGSLRLWVFLDGGGSIRNSNLFPKLTGRMQHRSHGLESWLGFALAKQSDPGKEAGITPHGRQVGSILVPFSSVMGDSEVVLQLSNGFTRPVLGEKSLGTDE